MAVRWTEARLRNLEPSSPVRSVSEQLPTFRLALLVSPLRWLSVQGSIASGNRLPTILELFGNRGNLLANPSLESERAFLFDAGLVAGRRVDLGRPVELFAELRFFGSEVTDLIRYRRTAQFTAVAENTASGQIRGVEGVMRVRLPTWLRVEGKLGWLDTLDQQGRALPLRPQWTGRAEVEVSTGPLMAWLDDVRGRVELDHIGDSWFDPANLVALSGRTVWSVAVVTTHGPVQVSAQLRDVFDVAGTDLLGFPLPGRQFDAAIAWTEVWP